MASARRTRWSWLFGRRLSETPDPHVCMFPRQRPRVTGVSELQEDAWIVERPEQASREAMGGFEHVIHRVHYWPLRARLDL
jgi:hypothetical protein